MPAAVWFAVKDKGSVALLPLVVILLVVVAVLFYFFKNNLLPSTTPLQTSQKSSTSVSLTTDYQNPFDKNSQYVNPFATYKNPFDTLNK